MLERRGFIGAMAAAMAAGSREARASADPDAAAIAAIERARGGRLGVFALDTGTGRSLAHRADERFPTESTFKGALAAMVLSRVASGQDRLDRSLSYGPGDLMAASPVTAAAVGAGHMTIGSLCAAILERSDNTAANLLLRHVGGPPALTGFVRGLGDPVSRFDRYEPIGPGRGDQDTSTPRAVADTARAMLLGPVLPPPERARLERWMAGNAHGLTRLRAAFPGGWMSCDRTGSRDGICDDYALARPPRRAPLVVAAFHDAPGMGMEAQEAVLREVGAAVVRWAA